jgi:phosphoribosyl-ATP pyrophosphohydrolase/phosphoribosyl-AMP cyclohydrolase
MNVDFAKGGGLVPAIVQDDSTGAVLMLGYMNEEAYRRTLEDKRVTFFSRSKRRLWTKGETSGNHLELKSMSLDCDGDALLVKAHPLGPVCHTGSDTCFGEKNAARAAGFLSELEKIIESRKSAPPESSYTAKLMAEGTAKVAQKVGEEATETVIEALKGDRERLKEESADLLFHLLVLLSERRVSLGEVEGVLRARHVSREKK